MLEFLDNIGRQEIVTGGRRGVSTFCRELSTCKKTDKGVVESQEHT